MPINTDLLKACVKNARGADADSYAEDIARLYSVGEQFMGMGQPQPAPHQQPTYSPNIHPIHQQEPVRRNTIPFPAPAQPEPVVSPWSSATPIPDYSQKHVQEPEPESAPTTLDELEDVVRSSTPESFIHHSAGHPYTFARDIERIAGGSGHPDVVECNYRCYFNNQPHDEHLLTPVYHRFSLDEPVDSRIFQEEIDKKLAAAFFVPKQPRVMQPPAIWRGGNVSAPRGTRPFDAVDRSVKAPRHT